MTVCVSTTCRRSSRQARTAAAETSTTAENTATGGQFEDSNPSNSDTTAPRPKVTTHISTASRGRVRSTTSVITARCVGNTTPHGSMP